MRLTNDLLNRPRFKEAQRKCASIEGYIADIECAILYELIERTKDQRIVEIGHYRGKSTAHMCLAAINSNSQIYSIDPHQYEGKADAEFMGRHDKPVYEKNVSPFHGKVLTSIYKTSKLANNHWPNQWKINLLFIDGDHKYHMVKQDIEMWAPLVSQNGIIILHDTKYWDGPQQVATEALHSGEYEDIKSSALNITILRKL